MYKQKKRSDTWNETSPSPRGRRRLPRAFGMKDGVEEYADLMATNSLWIESSQSMGEAEAERWLGGHYELGRAR